MRQVKLFDSGMVAGHFIPVDGHVTRLEGDFVQNPRVTSYDGVVVPLPMRRPL